MPGPVRVLWLIKGLGPGGAERLLVAAAAAHDPASVQLIVAHLLPYKDQLADELRAAGVEVVCLDAPRDRDLGWLARLRRLVLDRDIEVVHAHSPMVAGLARPVLRSLPQERRPALVSTEHNAWPTFVPATRWLNAATHRLDDAAFAVSREVRDAMPPAAAARTEVLVHGIDLARVRAQAVARDRMRDTLGATPSTVLVGTVANYRTQKAYPVLLHASAQVLADDDRVRFVAVGQGPERERIERLHAELGLGERVRLLGYREDAVEVLAACDIFCLSSDYEGLPVALMEALALGLPVVATGVGGIAETVEDGVHGRLVPPRDPDALADAILAVASDPDQRRQMGARAARLAERFDVRRVTERLEDVYRRLADRT